MKKIIKTILGASLVLAALPISLFCIGHNANTQSGLDEETSDPISTLALAAPLKTEASPVIVYSETYVQPGQYNKSDTDYICLRFSTAVYLGTDSGITDINYRRTYGSEVSEWKQVTTVYRGIKISNDVTNYYDPDNGLVTEDPHNDYYFACYTISIKPASVSTYSNVDFEMEIAINGTEDENIVFTSKCSYDTAMLPAANRHVLKKFDLNNKLVRKDIVAKKNNWTALDVANVTDNSLKEVVYTSGNKVRRLDQTYYETDPTKWNSGACNGYNDANATSGRGGNYTDKALAPLFATVDSKQTVYMSALHIDDPLQYNSKNSGKDYGFSEIRFAHTLASAKKVKFEYKYWDVNADISADDGGTSHAVCQFHDGSAYPTENMNLVNDNQWHTYEATYTKADSINLTHFVLKIYHMAGEMFIRNLIYFNADGKCDNHIFGSQEPKIDSSNNVYKECSNCGKVVLGTATPLTFEKDYSSSDGFHYHVVGSDLSFSSGVITTLNPSAINTNVANVKNITVRTSKIVSFYNLSLSAGSYIAFNDKIIGQLGANYYVLTFTGGQARTANNTTEAINSELTLKGYREYQDHMMIDMDCSNLGHGNSTNMAWTLGEAGRHTYWMVNLTRDGVTSDISAVPASRGGSFGAYFNGIQFYNTESDATRYFVRIDLKKSQLQAGDIITIKAGTMFVSASQKIDVLLHDMVLKFDGTFVCEDVHSSATPTTMEHWSGMGQLRFNGLNFLAPYETNGGYAATYVTGVKYQPAGGTAAAATGLSFAYWNKSGTFNGLWFTTVNGGSYAKGDKLIFEAGASFMLDFNSGNYRGRFTIDNGFAIEYNGTSWGLAA